MIRKYRIGNPIPTPSVVTEVPVEEGMLPGWAVDKEKKSISISMAKGDIVYGLGETVRGMNKRGWLYTSSNADEPFHLEEKNSLYASQNFILLLPEEGADCADTANDGSRLFGLYVDTPGVVHFDIGFTDLDTLTIRFEDFDADLYLIEEESPRGIVRELRRLTGRSYIPPKWAFGFGQSRWSYMNADAVREVVRSYREADVPIDSVYLDIDYMDHYKDFTINEEAFPEFADFVSEMKEEGVRLVPIIDAGVKIEEGYETYEEGVQNGYFCTKEDGELLVGAVWPGRVHFPDFLNTKAREWFGNSYQFLLDKGIEGFWNDMNEPAIFYTEDHLNDVFEKIDDFKGQNLDIRSFFKFKGLVGSLDKNFEDYKTLWHDYDGRRVRHDKVHNIYGFEMTRAAGEAFERLSPDKRILMFSRSSYIGMHRYGGVWTGDNRSWWSHVKLNLQQMPGLSMCGFLYSGADTGGFSADTTEDLMLRWTALSIFTPLFRDHAAVGTRFQELYRFPRIADLRNIVRLRYALLPYIYSEFMKAALGDDMYMLPLSFVYGEDARARRVEDQVLVGDSIMIAPVYEQNALGRYVYLPEEMKLLRFRAADDYVEEILPAGDHYIPLELNEVPVFLRKGKVLPLADLAAPDEDGSPRTIRNADDAFACPLTYITFDAAPESYARYDDDGVSRIS